MRGRGRAQSSRCFACVVANFAVSWTAGYTIFFAFAAAVPATKEAEQRRASYHDNVNDDAMQFWVREKIWSEAGCDTSAALGLHPGLRAVDVPRHLPPLTPPESKDTRDIRRKRGVSYEVGTGYRNSRIPPLRELSTVSTLSRPWRTHLHRRRLRLGPRCSPHPKRLNTVAAVKK